jgi:hypothetical protein
MIKKALTILTPKTNLTLVASIILFGLFIQNCSSTDEDPSCPNNYKGELTPSETSLVGIWALTNMISEEAVDITDDNVDNPSTDIFNQLNDCSKDLKYEFKSNRRYTFKKNSVEDSCDDPWFSFAFGFNHDGTWKLDENQFYTVDRDALFCIYYTFSFEINNESTEFAIQAIFSFNDFSVNSDTILTFKRM